jgi:hypothetical protein
VSAGLEVDPAALDQVAALLTSVLDEPAVAIGDVAGFGSARVQEAAREVRGLLHAGGRATAEELGSATAAVRSASRQWRSQDARLVGRR